MPVGSENSSQPSAGCSRGWPVRLPSAFTMGKPERPRHQLWSLAYLTVRRVLSLVLRTSDSKQIEILVLRQELEILRRQQSRPPLDPVDRAWLCALSRLLAKERGSARWSPV